MMGSTPQTLEDMTGQTNAGSIKTPTTEEVSGLEDCSHQPSLTGVRGSDSRNPKRGDLLPTNLMGYVEDLTEMI